MQESVITHFDPFEYNVFRNIMENGAFAMEHNAPFSIIFSEYLKLYLFFLNNFSILSENRK